MPESSCLDCLPWQRDLARRWLGERDRFAHAWLIHGQPGVGQLAFALAGAAALLCEQPRPDHLACGQCQACRWVVAGNHPDLRRVRPDAVAMQEGAQDIEIDGKRQPSKEIRIDQLRQLLPWFNLATHRGGWRVAVVYPAESLNVTAANALLKTLEEPPSSTVFLLVSDAPDRLAPTLLSRCRRLLLRAPRRADALHWLEQQGVTEQAADRLSAAGGAPLLALEQATRPLLGEHLKIFLKLARSEPDKSRHHELSEPLARLEPVQWIDDFQRLWLDLRLVACGLPARYYPGMDQDIRQAASRMSATEWAKRARWLVAQRRLAHHALNPKLLAAEATTSLLTAFEADHHVC